MFNRKLAVIFLGYLAITLLVVLNHEPWRDEAEIWLTAREANWRDIFALLPYKGGLPLPFLLIAPFAKAGFPFLTQQLLIWFFAGLTAYLILYKSPFPILVRALIVFSYPIFFEYPIIAREYVIGIFFILLCTITFNKSPWRFVFPVTLACLVHPLSFMIGGAFLLAYIFKDVQLRLVSNKPSLLQDFSILVLILPITVIIGTIYFMQHPEDGQRIALAADSKNLRIFLLFNYGLIKNDLLAVNVWQFLMSFGLFVGLIRNYFNLISKDQKTYLPITIFLFVGILSVGYILYFIRNAGERHAFFLYIPILVVYWLIHSQVGSIAQKAKYHYQILIFALLLSNAYALFYLFQDLNGQYSGGRKMAQCIETAVPNHSIVAANPKLESLSVISQLGAGVKGDIPKLQFWFPGEQRDALYPQWDRRYQEASILRNNHIVQILLSPAAPSKQFFYLTNFQLDQTYHTENLAKYFTEVCAVPIEDTIKRESYFLYQVNLG